MRSWTLLAAAILVSSISFGQVAARNPELERGKQALEELHYSDAAKALDAAWLTPGNDRPTVLEILELQAVVAASSGQIDRAKTLFRSLLYLAPNFELPEGDLGPKVLTLFYEAKGRAKLEGVLQFEEGTTASDLRQVHQVSVRAIDPQQVGQDVRFHFRAPGRGWTSRIVALADNQAALVVDAPAVDWWAELLGEQDRVLVELGSADQPMAARALGKGLPQPQPPSAAFSFNLPHQKTFAFVAAGAGVVAGITGLVFGIRSNNWRNQIVAAQKDSQGRIIGITREKALYDNEQMRGSATVANAMFATAAVFIGTGVALYLLAPEVAVSASPAGVALAGRFP